MPRIHCCWERRLAGLLGSDECLKIRTQADDCWFEHVCSAIRGRRVQGASLAQSSSSFTDHKPVRQQPTRATLVLVLTSALSARRKDGGAAMFAACCVK